MDKKHPNPLTLADLKEALTGLATQEDLKALAPQETVSAIMETVAETKEGMTLLGKSRRSIATAMEESFSRGMSSVSLAFKRGLCDRVSARF
jgi:hypothetical protein